MLCLFHEIKLPSCRSTSMRGKGGENFRGPILGVISVELHSITMGVTVIESHGNSSLTFYAVGEEVITFNCEVSSHDLFVCFGSSLDE